MVQRAPVWFRAVVRGAWAARARSMSVESLRRRFRRLPGMAGSSLANCSAVMARSAAMGVALYLSRAVGRRRDGMVVVFLVCGYF